MSEKFIFKKIEDNGKIYRLQTKIGCRVLSLTILEEAEGTIKAYKTPMILEQNLKKQAELLGKNVTEYFDKLVHYFENPEDIKFVLNKSGLTMKEAVNTHLQIKYFHSEVTQLPDPSSFMGQFIDELILQKAILEKDQHCLIERNSILKSEVCHYKDKLRDLVQRKNLDDQMMLSNFVSLLNEKKKRIQHLNDLLEAFKINPSIVNPAEVNVSVRKKRKGTKVNSNIKTTPVEVKEEVSEESNTSEDEYKTSDSENGSTTGKVNAENETLVSRYVDDIFDDSPPTKLKPLPSLLPHQETYTTVCIPTPSTSKESEKKAVLLESEGNYSGDFKPCHSNIIDTQEWLDGL